MVSHKTGVAWRFMYRVALGVAAGRMTACYAINVP